MSEGGAKKRRTQTERRDEAEQRMMAAAVELIAEKGFRGLVLGDVGTRAGYSPALPVHYFKTKEALIVQVADRIIAEYTGVLRSKMKPGASGLEALRHYVHIYLQYAYEKRGDRRAFFMITSEAAVDAPLRESIATLSRSGAAHLAKLIREGQASGEIEPMIDADIHGTLILATLRGLVSLWAGDEQVDLARLAVALEGSLVYSLRSRDAVQAKVRRKAG